MKAAIYHGIENVSVEEIPMPECGDNDVILKTCAEASAALISAHIITAAMMPVFSRDIHSDMKCLRLYIRKERMFLMI